MLEVLKRALRSAIPLGVLIVSGTIQNNPKTVFLVPILAAVGKAVRDKYPDNILLNHLMPF